MKNTFKMCVFVLGLFLDWLLLTLVKVENIFHLIIGLYSSETRDEVVKITSPGGLRDAILH